MTLAIVRQQGLRPYPPRASVFTRRFWQALETGQFLCTRCRECARASFPPRPFCPHCWSEDVEWVALSGRGTIYSLTRVHAAPALFSALAPYHVGIVDLAEGPRIATRLLGIDEGFPIGAPVVIEVQLYDDGPLFAARVDPSIVPKPP